MPERGCLYGPLFTNCREGFFSETQRHKKSRGYADEPSEPQFVRKYACAPPTFSRRLVLHLRCRAVSVAGPPLAGGRGDAGAGQPHPRLVERLTRGGCARQRRRGGERGYPRARVDAADQRLLDHVLSAALPVRCAAE